jgi:anaerobic magnesium-protoporphyrin IX monomethyl ester cyclase
MLVRTETLPELTVNSNLDLQKEKISGRTVCLIIPPSNFLLDERVFMTLGILRIAAVLEEAGVNVEMLDLSGVQNYEDVTRVHALDSKADTFALTATTPQMPAAGKLAAVLRESKANSRIILGGPHITLVNAAYKKELFNGINGRAASAYNKCAIMFDTLVAGDGEQAIFLALDEAAPKLINADDPKSALFLNNSKLNELPFPARHLVDVNSYHYSVDGVRALSLIAQLGCPFACGFCGGRESPMLRRVRTRTSESVVQEISEMHEKYGVNGFMLYDDELNVNPKMIELMKLIEAEQKKIGEEFRLRGFIKAQLFTDEHAEAMYNAGFRWMLTGFESGSPRILQNINKSATLEENTRCMEIAKRHGLKVKSLMSIGHPGESHETIMQTQDWLMRVKPDDFDVTIITTYPGTPYYDRAVKDPDKEGVWTYIYPKTGDRLHAIEVDYLETADYYKGDPNGGYKSYVYTDELSAEALVELRDRVEKHVRDKLGIPFNPSGSAIRYEHSMGQHLPQDILRRSF